MKVILVVISFFLSDPKLELFRQAVKLICATAKTLLVFSATKEGEMPVLVLFLVKIATAGRPLAGIAENNLEGQCVRSERWISPIVKVNRR